MTAPIIILDNVDLKFPKLKGILSAIKDKLTGKTTSFTALKNVNLEINSGEVFGLIGKNGSGKSTILRVISGIYPPDEGQCKVSGSISLLAGLGTGFSGHQTGVENALLYGSILGHNEHEMREMLPEIIQFSELVKLKAKQIHQSNPKNILKKGYAIIRDKKYRIVKNSILAKNNDHLKIEMVDGYVDVFRKKKKT